MNTPKPATPLPWKHEQHDARICISGCEHLHGVYVEHSNPSHNIAGTVKEILAENCEPDDAAYIVHACNVYPQLIADRARLIEALQKTNELVARGHVEGAYNAIAAGPQYAERVMAATASLLRELGEG